MEQQQKTQEQPTQGQTTTYRTFKDVNVALHSYNPQINGRVMNGKALMTQEEDRFTFVEAPKRVNRSKLILASNHASLRRRKDGRYSINIVFVPNEKYVKEQLVTETRGLAMAAMDDMAEEAKNKAELQKTTTECPSEK